MKPSQQADEDGWRDQSTAHKVIELVSARSCCFNPGLSQSKAQDDATGKAQPGRGGRYAVFPPSCLSLGQISLSQRNTNSDVLVLIFGSWFAFAPISPCLCDGCLWNPITPPSKLSCNSRSHWGTWSLQSQVERPWALGPDRCEAASYPFSFYPVTSRAHSTAPNWVQRQTNSGLTTDWAGGFYFFFTFLMDISELYRSRENGIMRSHVPTTQLVPDAYSHPPHYYFEA